ncbi:lysosomal acid glucosylceramidase isoform X2 [Cherax quadricarinatus]|uniref:lysosomal acid glucosylceramidase isoform X2 n=2 Tax=Cherax quadricarinatus TaxID=27406 RepID=UPI00387EBAA2
MRSTRMMTASSSVPVLLILFCFGVSLGDEQLPCLPRQYGGTSFVCVCNATYCDTLPTPQVPPEGQFLVYTSDLSGSRFNKSQGAFSAFRSGASREAVEVVLDTRVRYQTILGWGGAFTDAAAANILSLSQPAQDNLLRSYFSSSGLEYNIGRVNMGGCDFSWRPYTYDDVEGDVDLQSFALQPEDLQYKIPVIKSAAAMAARPLILFASPWTAPPWMKTNNDYIGYGQLLPEMYQPWADYFVKFLDSYALENITFWGVTAQNEPSDGYIPFFSFNCMGWTPAQQTAWVGEHLGPTLRAHGYHDLKLMILDDQRIELPLWAEEVLTDSIAGQYVDGIAVHWYWDAMSSAHRLNTTHHLFPDVFILATEACEGLTGSAMALGSWERLEHYAHDIIDDMNNWVTGWVDWNLALDMEGGPNWANNFVDAVVIVNKETDEFYKNPMFYALGHFSKFVQAGAERLDVTSSDLQVIQVTAFVNPDQTFVVVLLNRSEEEVEVTVNVEERGTMFLNMPPRSLLTALFL